MRKLAVCYPGEMPAVFMLAFSSIVNIQNPPDCEVKWFKGNGWCQARRRIHMCEQALDWNADLIVQLDIDQVYEPDILCRLVTRYDEGYPVIAAMVPGRGHVADNKLQPFQRLAWRSTQGGRAFEPVDPSAGEVQECDFPTSACVIFEAALLNKLSKPWYAFKYAEDTWKPTGGEDGLFFWRIRNHIGIKTYVDTTLKVGHAHVFEIDETFPDRFADWAEAGKGDPAICRYEPIERN